MPKKTRKQKLRADDRHTHVVPQVSDNHSSVLPATTAMFQFQAVKQKMVPVRPADATELSAIRTDLVRTILLAGVAVGTELYVYWRFFR